MKIRYALLAFWPTGMVFSLSCFKRLTVPMQIDWYRHEQSVTNSSPQFTTKDSSPPCTVQVNGFTFLITGQKFSS